MKKFNEKAINGALKHLNVIHEDLLFDYQVAGDEDFSILKDEAIMDFKDYFDNDNEWVDEECSSYEQDKKDFIEIVVNRFRNNN